MEIKLNISEWGKLLFKIPIPIALVGVTLISGGLLLMPSELREILCLQESYTVHGKYIGLLFVSCTISLIIYGAVYLKKIIASGWHKSRYKAKTLRKIKELSPDEKALIMQLYHSAAYTAQLNDNDPIVKGLSKRNFIFPLIPCSFFIAGMDTSFSYELKSWVIETIDDYRQKLEKKITKLEKKISKTKGHIRNEKVQKRCSELKQIYHDFFEEWR